MIGTNTKKSYYYFRNNKVRTINPWYLPIILLFAPLFSPIALFQYIWYDLFGNGIKLTKKEYYLMKIKELEDSK